MKRNRRLFSEQGCLYIKYVCLVGKILYSSMLSGKEAAARGYGEAIPTNECADCRLINNCFPI